jgi:AraC-like DNA-binding protein
MGQFSSRSGHFVRNTLIDPYEDVPRDVVVTGNDYPRPRHQPAHRHQRGQLLYPSSGVVTVDTVDGSWVVPPQRALWIPPGCSHAVRTSGPVAMRNAFVRACAAIASGLPLTCRVLAVSPLLHALLHEAVDLPAHYALDDRDGRIMALLLDEVARMPALPLSTPLPSDRRLLALCHQLLAKPELSLEIDAAALHAGMSRRHFTRQFREQTGMSYGAWRQHARLLAALVRLGGGEPVTRVALELGYHSSSAFTSVFRRVLGAPPSRYLMIGPSTQ